MFAVWILNKWSLCVVLTNIIRFMQANLLQDAGEQVIHLVVDRHRSLNKLAAEFRRNFARIFETNKINTEVTFALPLIIFSI